MLKIRVMPVLLFKPPTLVKGRGFDSWRRIEVPQTAIRVYNMREVDELVLVDITASGEGRSPDLQLIDQLADDCFMPFAVGGGIRSVEDVRGLLSVGADKVVVNSAAIETPNLIDAITAEFGSQVLVVSIDFRRDAAGKATVHSHSGSRPTGLDPVAWAQEAARRGAGEILLTSIERDGNMEGYDVEMTRQVSASVSIPVIAAGGAGNYGHMVDVLENGGAAAVAAASIFHFTEQTPKEAKIYLRERGFATRLA